MVRTSVQWIEDKFHRRMGATIEWTIIGVKIVADQATPALTQAALTTALTTMETAYASDFQDWVVYLDDGTTPSVHSVLNSATFGGTKVVVPPSYMNGPWTGRVEYLNRRTYHIVLRAEIRVGTGLYAWNERLTVRGTGGPKWRYSPQEVGSPQAQTLQTLTSFWYVQEGEAIGREDWPEPSDPFYPSIEHGEMRVVSYDSPKDDVVGGQEMFGTSWSYKMEAVVDQGFDPFDTPSIDDF